MQAVIKENFEGFKAFLMRGNVVDLAVAVVVGAAFTSIVNAFTSNIIKPLIAALGGAEVKGFGIHIISGNPATFIDFGALITAVINFLIVASVVYFLFVLPMNKYKEVRARQLGLDPKAEEVPADVALLTEIRDMMAAEQKKN
ncbi:MAG: large conductance mechanosensitive channel protein MscL [Corynebacterium pyruviciproducens]|uniref:Large-conductance mechanosensitive channel n=1 Tax=Corynebacterium pyruviciproducens TaxID=598660 RepID=A0AAF1BS75_9CORY|nr:large conductance mechanosensitive channel protein MscL [Corynebacterium pyruviciproducens]MDK6564827.1 large conductance mechanosensitive channel protein MscL [Corynebacterium pyruviciproducens]WOT02508.1 large conductance mechanosensitive channel protein MscL [Corynebacterium pyruviciproducens]